MWRYTVVTGLFLLFTHHFQNTNGYRSFTINISNASISTYSDKYIANISVNQNAFNLYLQVKKDIPNPMLSMEIKFQSPETGQYNVELMNRTIEMCKFFSNNLYEPLMQIIYRIMQEFGDIPKSCPIKKKSYHYENVTIDAEQFPPYIPERRGYAKCTFLENDNDLLTPAVEVIIFFEIKSKAIKRFKAVRRK